MADWNAREAEAIADEIVAADHPNDPGLFERFVTLVQAGAATNAGFSYPVSVIAWAVKMRETPEGAAVYRKIRAH